MVDLAVPRVKYASPRPGCTSSVSSMLADSRGYSIALHGVLPRDEAWPAYELAPGNLTCESPIGPTYPNRPYFRHSKIGRHIRDDKALMPSKRHTYLACMHCRASILLANRTSLSIPVSCISGSGLRCWSAFTYIDDEAIIDAVKGTLPRCFGLSDAV